MVFDVAHLMEGVTNMHGSSAPSLARLSASSITLMFVYTQTFMIVMLCGEFLMAYICMLLEAYHDGCFGKRGCVSDSNQYCIKFGS